MRTVAGVLLVHFAEAMEPAPVGMLCPIRNEGLRQLTVLSRSYSEAIQRAHESPIGAVEYLSLIQEARAIHQHLGAVRRALQNHRAEHGC
jgi:hypothetical protein